MSKKFFNYLIYNFSFSGILLIISTLCALIIANSNLEFLYKKVIDFPISTLFNITTIPSLTLLTFINNGLMVIFFFTVGLEIRFKLFTGFSNSYTKVAFPIVSAFGGMIVPVLIFYFINRSEPLYSSGWAIPASTDIAFASSILLFFRKKIPTNLKTFLLTLAILDDLGAIVIIAFFYNHNFNLIFFLKIQIIIIILFTMNYIKIYSIVPYIFVGILLWVYFLLSGIHPTLSGVILSIFIPNFYIKNTKIWSIQNLYKQLQPFVNYCIIPIFAFVNSGINFHGITIKEIFSSHLSLGIILGLVLGKPIGIILFAKFSTKFRLSKVPDGIDFIQISAVSILCGIGFTMSIFIATLAFNQQPLKILLLAKISILIGSIISAFFGCFVLKFILRKT